MKIFFMLLVVSTVSISCATNNSDDMKRGLASLEKNSSLRFKVLFCDGVEAAFEAEDAAIDTSYCKALKARQLEVSTNPNTGNTILRANLLIRSPSKQKGFIQTCSGKVDSSTKLDSLKDVSCVSVYEDTANYRKVLCQAIDKKMELEHADAAIDTKDCLTISDDKTSIEFSESLRVVVSADVLIRSPGHQEGRRTSCKAYVDGVATDANVLAVECK